jgi:hypothetical protein
MNEEAVFDARYFCSPSPSPTLSLAYWSPTLASSIKQGIQNQGTELLFIVLTKNKLLIPAPN